MSRGKLGNEIFNAAIGDLDGFLNFVSEGRFMWLKIILCIIVCKVLVFSLVFCWLFYLSPVGGFIK